MYRNEVVYRRKPKGKNTKGNSINIYISELSYHEIIKKGHNVCRIFDMLDHLSFSYVIYLV